MVGVALVGCGGGSSSSEGDTTNPLPEENTVLLIESGTTSFSGGKPYNIKGSSDIYYDTVGCRLSGLSLTNFSVYDNGSVETFYTKNSTTYSSTCYIKGAYENVALNNTTEVNASYVNYNTFYDNATKIFYDHDGYSHDGNYRLVEIINDGMNAIVDTGGGNTVTVQIEAAYRKIQ